MSRIATGARCFPAARRHGGSRSDRATAPPSSPPLWRRPASSGIEVTPTYRSLATAAQELRDRIKGSALPIRLVAFPFLVGAVWLERLGITWGRPNALLATARRPRA